MKLSRAALAAASFLLVGLSTTPTLAAQDKGPAAPTRLWAAQTSPTTVTLVWQLVPGAVGYSVFGPKPASGKSDVSAELLARLGSNASRYVARVAGPGWAHHYFVQAVDAKGQASPKAEFNPVVPPVKQAISAVPAPNFLKAEVTGPGEITLRWDAVPGATAYTIGRSVRPQGIGRLCELCPTETMYVDHDAVAGAVHIYRVTAIAPQGTSRPVLSGEVIPTVGKQRVAVADPKEAVPPAADPKEARPADPKDALPPADPKEARPTVADPKEALPKAPSGVRATFLTPTSIRLSWITGTGTATLQIKRKVGMSVAQLIATVNGTVSSFLDQLGNAAGGMISYQLTAVNAKGAAEPVSVTVDPAKAATDSAGAPPKAASGLKATVLSSTGIRLDWTPGMVGGMYRLMRDAAGKSEVIATLPGSVANFLDHFRPGAMPGVINYWIEAVDGKAAASEKITVATGKEAADPQPGSSATDTAPPSPPSDLKATVTAPNTVTLTWTGRPARYEVRRSITGAIGGTIKAIGQTVEGVFRFVDQLPPMPWAKSQSIVYIVVALGSGVGAITSKQASVTVTIDPQKAAATVPPAATDSAAEEGDMDSLPRPRPRVQ